MYVREEDTLSHSHSHTRMAPNSGVASLTNVMSTFERANNILDPVYNKCNKRFNLYG